MMCIDFICLPSFRPYQFNLGQCRPSHFKACHASRLSARQRGPAAVSLTPDLTSPVIPLPLRGIADRRIVKASLDFGGVDPTLSSWESNAFWFIIKTVFWRVSELESSLKSFGSSRKSSLKSLFVWHKCETWDFSPYLCQIVTLYKGCCKLNPVPWAIENNFLSEWLWGAFPESIVSLSWS